MSTWQGSSEFALWIPQVKLIDYIHRQRQCKLSVPLSDRTAELNSYPRFNDWLDIVNVRKEVVQVRRGAQSSHRALLSLQYIPSCLLALTATAGLHHYLFDTNKTVLHCVLCPTLAKTGPLLQSHTHIELSPLTAKQSRKGFFYYFSHFCLCRPGHNVLIQFPLIVKQPKIFLDLSRNLPG